MISEVSGSVDHHADLFRYGASAKASSVRPDVSTTSLQAALWQNVLPLLLTVLLSSRITRVEGNSIPGFI